MSESPTEHWEHAEHAEHAAESGQPFLAVVSVTIAILAVVAATVGSLESIETADTISAKNESVLSQNKATDQWNFFQAKSIKKNLYDIASAGNPAKADDYAREAKRYGEENDDVLKKAKAFEDESQRHSDDAEIHEHRHHVMTLAVTFLHVSIAIATLSIIMRGARWPWYTAIGLGLAGVATTLVAYV